MAAIVILKLVATGAAVGARLPGGLIGRTLVMGSAAGALLGMLTSMTVGFHVHIGSYAMLGMAAMMAATLRTSFASLVGVYELTGDANVFLPGIATVVAALLVAQLFWERDSIVDVQLKEAKCNALPVRTASDSASTWL